MVRMVASRRLASRVRRRWCVAAAVAGARRVGPRRAGRGRAATYQAPVSPPGAVHRRPLPAAAHARTRPATAGSTTPTAPGTPVVASAAGQVVFAGPVAGTLHVTIVHPDGLRTTYSFLAAVAGARGRPGRAGPT